MVGRRITCGRGLPLWLVLVASLVLLPSSPHANHDAKRLYDDLLKKNNYNRLVRPVAHTNDSMLVHLGIKLSQIVDVDEKNEILSTNVWLTHKWVDNNLRWNPEEYGGVSLLYVPSELIWLPDIVLYNNADGDYTITMFTKATLSSSGRVVWEPPSIFKSHCDIDVEFFPFDQQTCFFKFGSWTYGGMVDLRHVWLEKLGIKDVLQVIDIAWDLKDYYANVEWDVMRVPARKNIVYYPCCGEEPYPDVTFNITLRRRTLYYTINLIIPCFAINMLTMLAFYLPSDCGEKISISISILLSLSLFQLLLMDLVPATSLKLPLLGKYLLFTTILVSVSVFSSVIVLNINYHSSATHKMARWIKWTFLQAIPKVLLMKRPVPTDFGDNKNTDLDFLDVFQSELSGMANTYSHNFQRLDLDNESTVFQSSFIGLEAAGLDLGEFCQACAARRLAHYPPNVQKAVDGIGFIAKHLKDEDDSTQVKEEWKYMALVIDRILLMIYMVTCLICGMGILLDAPILYDNNRPITETFCDDLKALMHVQSLKECPEIDFL